MTIRWVFYFQEGSVVTDLESEIEDMRLQDVLADQKEGFVTFPSGKLDVYANLSLVKCITREQLEEKKQEDIPVIEPELVE